MKTINLESEIQWVSHYLPHQGTLQYFVHHNPLEAFEKYPFEKACSLAKIVYKGKMFLEQKEYLNYIRLEKISQSALLDQLHEIQQIYPISSKLKNTDLFLNLMLSPPELTVESLIQKHLGKHQPDLVAEISQHVQGLCPSQNEADEYYSATYKDLILEQDGIDIDQKINPILAKFLSSYTDPGATYWKNEYTEKGLWECFQENYRSAFILENTQAKAIHQELQGQHIRELNTDQLILYYANKLCIEDSNLKKYLLAMSLRLRGWAGLFTVLEHEPQQILDQKIFSLKEFLLVKLLLEYLVCSKHIAQFHTGLLGAYTENQKQAETQRYQSEWVYLVLHFLSINHDLDEQLWPEDLSQQGLMVSQLRLLMQKERFEIYQKSLEKTYIDHCFNAFKYSFQLKEAPKKRIKFQYVSCIDDREGSVRRYIEQVEPESETFGVAGHFEMNMYFKGFNEIRFRKLCPGNTQETFNVIQTKRHKKRLSGVYARLLQNVSTHSKFSIFAYFITLSLGILSIVPFLLKVFFPGLDLSIRRKFKKVFLYQMDLIDLVFIDQGNPEGINYQEGAQKVFQLLKTIDLSKAFGEFVYLVGHGSSSINNPHEYAYNCGACGGGKARPNGRIFSLIANHPEVRRIIFEDYGLKILPETVFMGGYHDTCNDTVVWFDGSLTPDQALKHKINAEKIKQAMHLNASERAHKFHNIAANLGTEASYRRVSLRSNDLTEARPEYNHATNALCVIGRRDLTKKIFLDRRAFLSSYNPDSDDSEGSLLADVMAAVVPVCAGINLEYYFSRVDSEVFGCGSKLNHNITNNYAVMSGFASDLRLGLSKQMVEIHDPRRILLLIESRPEIVLLIMRKNQRLNHLIRNHWLSLMVYDSKNNSFYLFKKNDFIEMNADDLDRSATPFYAASEDIHSDYLNLIPIAILDKQSE